MSHLGMVASIVVIHWRYVHNVDGKSTIQVVDVMLSLSNERVVCLQMHNTLKHHLFLQTPELCYADAPVDPSEDFVDPSRKTPCTCAK